MSGVRVCLRAHSIQCAGFGHYARGQRLHSHDSASVCAGRTPICVKYLVEKEQAASTPHTRILPNMAWSRLYRPPYAFRAAWASCWLCFLCCEKHHSCSLLRGIHSYAFLMQPAIFPRSSEARVDNPTLPSAIHDSPHTPGFGLARERGYLCISSLTAAPHALASMRPTSQRRRTWLIYLRNNQTKEE